MWPHDSLHFPQVVPSTREYEILPLDYLCHHLSTYLRSVSALLPLALWSSSPPLATDGVLHSRPILLWFSERRRLQSLNGHDVLYPVCTPLVVLPSQTQPEFKSHRLARQRCCEQIRTNIPRRRLLRPRISHASFHYTCILSTFSLQPSPHRPPSRQGPHQLRRLCLTIRNPRPHPRSTSPSHFWLQLASCLLHIPRFPSFFLQTLLDKYSCALFPPFRRSCVCRRAYCGIAPSARHLSHVIPALGVHDV